MPNRSAQPPARQSSGLFTFMPVGAGVLGAFTLILLTAGTLTHHNGLLTWAMVCGMVALDLVVLLAVKRMIDDAVARCVAMVKYETDGAVASTAVKVGEAIALGLREDEDAHVSSVTRVYSGR